MHKLLQKALESRAPLPDESTDAFRVFEGGHHGLPVLEIDAVVGRWLPSHPRRIHLPVQKFESDLKLARSAPPPIRSLNR
ncbi:MAG: hypothetical protein H7A50_07070 [Akkermansiaceae bacterium]|nr:hypothetical protein [Akkermansiaceae bacterium]